MARQTFSGRGVEFVFERDLALVRSVIQGVAHWSISFSSCAEVVDAARPIGPVAGQPLTDLRESLGIDLVFDEAALTLLLHKASRAQDRKVLGHRGLADRHAAPKIARIHGTDSELFEDASPGRVREGFENVALHGDR